MRRLMPALVLFAAFAATPVLAQDVAGFYAGIYGGVSSRNDTNLQLDEVTYGLSPGGPVKTPTEFVNDGDKLDSTLLELLNRGVQTIDYPSFATSVFVPNLLTSGTMSFGSGKLAGFVFGYDFGGVRVDADVSATAFAGATYTPTNAREEVATGVTDGTVGKFTWFEVFNEPSSGGIPPADTLEDSIKLKLDTAVQFFLVDAYYDIDTGTAFTPYIGGGLGVARVSSTLTDLCSCIAGGPYAVNSSTAYVPAAQIGGGVRIAIAKPVMLDVGYRYRLAANPNLKVYEVAPFDAPFSGFDGFATKQSGIIGIHTVTAGLTFALN